MRFWAVVGLCAVVAAPAGADSPDELPPVMWERIRAVQPELIDLTPTPSPPAPEELSLKQCIELAFRQNRGFRSAQESLLSARRGFWVTAQRISYSVSGTVDSEHPYGGATSDVASASASANWTGTYGDSIGVGLNTGSQRSFGHLFSDQPSVSISYSVPLLQGAGRASSRYQALRQARFGLIRSQFSFYESHQSLALSIIQKYFAALQAQDEIQIQRRDLRRKQEFYDKQYTHFTGEGIKDPDEEWATLTPGTTAVVDFEMVLVPAESPAISGAVTAPDGAPLASATLRVYDSTGRFRAKTATDADGGYTIAANLVAGSARIKCERPGFATRDTSVTLAAGETAVVDFELETVAPGSLSLGGTVTAAERETPIEGAVVSVLDATGHVIATAATDADGKYAISENLMVGSVGATCALEGYFTDHEWVVLKADEPCIADFELHSAPGKSPLLTGIIEAVEGTTPLEGVTVQVFDATGQLRATGTTGPDGRYSISEKLPVGAARVTCQIEGAVPHNPWVTRVAAIEVDRALLALEQAKQQLIQNEQSIQDTMDALLLEIGLEPGASPKLTTTVGYEPQDYEEAAVIETTLDNSFRLARLNLNRIDALASRRQAYSAAKPRLTGSASLRHPGETSGGGPTGISWGAGLTISVPLWQRGLAESKANAERSLLLFEQGVIEARDSEEQAVRKLLRANEADKASIAIGERNVELAQKSRDMVQAMFEEGLAGYDYLDVRDADESLVAAERSLLRQKVSYYLTVIRIRRTLGEDITQRLPD